jgi:dienelactone hydrolase
MLDPDSVKPCVVPHKVKVASWNPFLLHDLPDEGEEPGFPVEGELYLPNSDTPSPAIVFSQGLGGVRDARERSYAAALSDQGYASLIIDSFKARGADGYSEPRRALHVTESMILGDAYAALRYLAARPDIDPARIFIVGFSYGGMISVLSAHEQFAKVFLPDGLRFAGHVSYYGCTVPRMENTRTSEAPVTIMQGGKDGNISLERSKEIADDVRRGGSPVHYTVFPEAYHQWESAETRRSFVQFNLASCRLHVGADGTIEDERTGLRINGPVSRTLAITIGANPMGYYMRRDDEIKRRSDAILMEALSHA